MDGPIPEGSGSPDGFLYEGLEYRSVTHFRALSFIMSSCCFFLAPNYDTHSAIAVAFVAKVMNQK